MVDLTISTSNQKELSGVELLKVTFKCNLNPATYIYIHTYIYIYMFVFRNHGITLLGVAYQHTLARQALNDCFPPKNP